MSRYRALAAPPRRLVEDDLTSAARPRRQSRGRVGLPYFVEGPLTRFRELSWQPGAARAGGGRERPLWSSTGHTPPSARGAASISRDPLGPPASGAAPHETALGQPFRQRLPLKRERFQTRWLCACGEEGCTTSTPRRVAVGGGAALYFRCRPAAPVGAFQLAAARSLVAA